MQTIDNYNFAGKKAIVRVADGETISAFEGV